MTKKLYRILLEDGSFWVSLSGKSVWEDRFYAQMDFLLQSGKKTFGFIKEVEGETAHV